MDYNQAQPSLGGKFKGFLACICHMLLGIERELKCLSN